MQYLNMNNNFLFIFLPIVLHITVTEGVFKRHMGCYKEISIESRLMTGDYKHFGRMLMEDTCFTHCRSLEYAYSGEQAGAECYCSNERPSFKYSTDKSDCSVPCEGDKSKACGGHQRMFVYDILDKGVNYVDSYYKGCYLASELGLQAKLEAHLTTPESCLGVCFRNGYLFSGTKAGKECFCGDELKGPPVFHYECKSKCYGQDKLFCGGPERLSVYATSIPDECLEGRFDGCYLDDEKNRMLSAYNLTLEKTNSPRRCMNICLQLGYSYSGVENGVECYCGNRKPDKRKEVNENECLSMCPNGLSRTCGGEGRLSVYSTFALEKNCSGHVNEGHFLNFF